MDPESWALKSGIQIKKSGILLTIGIQNPNSTDKDLNPVPGIRNPEYTAWNPESRAVFNSLTWGDKTKLLEQLWIIFRLYGSHSIKSMPWSTFRFDSDVLFPTAEIYSFIFSKILIFSSSLKWFIGMTPKKNRGFIFFRQRRALINIQKETVSHRKERKWTLTIVQKNWIIDNHFRKKWISTYIYLSSHSVGEPIMKQISHLSVVCIGNHMISSAIWNK